MMSTHAEMLAVAAVLSAPMLAHPRYRMTRAEHCDNREKVLRKRRNRMRRKMAKASQRRNRP